MAHWSKLCCWRKKLPLKAKRHRRNPIAGVLITITVSAPLAAHLVVVLVSRRYILQVALNSNANDGCDRYELPSGRRLPDSSRMFPIKRLSFIAVWYRCNRVIRSRCNLSSPRLVSPAEIPFGQVANETSPFSRYELAAMCSPCDVTLPLYPPYHHNHPILNITAATSLWVSECVCVCVCNDCVIFSVKRNQSR